MKRYLLALFLTLSLQCGFTQTGPAGMPGLREVEERFFTTYSGTDLPQGAMAWFERRPDGWWVQILERPKMDEPFPHVKFWDRQTAEFVELGWAKHPEGSKPSVKSHPNWVLTPTTEFERNYYAGYPRAWEDVINDLGNRKDLNDSLYYYLSRAQGMAAQLLLDPSNTWLGGKANLQRPPGNNSLSKEDLKGWRDANAATRSSLQKVRDLNPGFETATGNIHTRLAHHHVIAFTDLWMYQNEQEALSEIPKSLYDPFSLAMARNYLNSCPKDAVLFTETERDTYPLLYLQARENVRRDVVVINLYLLHTARYALRFETPPFRAKPLKFSFQESDFEDDQLSYWMIQGKGWDSDPVKLNDFLQKAKQGIVTETSYGNSTLPSNFIDTPWEGETLELFIEQPYVLRNTMLVLDIISNNPTRPLCFTKAKPFQEGLLLDPYLQREGLVYRLRALDEPSDEFPETIPMNDRSRTIISTQYPLLMEQLEWPQPVYRDQPSADQIADIRRCFNQLILALMFVGEHEKARAAIDRMLTLYPRVDAPFSTEMIGTLQSYYDLNELEKARSLALELAADLSVWVENDEDSHNQAKKQREFEMLFEVIGRQAEKLGQTDVTDALKNLIAQIESKARERDYR